MGKKYLNVGKLLETMEESVENKDEFFSAIIASLYPEVIQIVTRKDAGIMSVKDLKGKSVIPGDRGSGTAVDAENILKAAGMSFDDFGTLDWLSFSGISQRMQDNQADAGFITA